MKLVYLLSHVPNPRIYKRIKVAKSYFNISTIYWKRAFNDYETFLQDEAITKYEFVDKGYAAYNLSVFKRLFFLIKFMVMAMTHLRVIKPKVIHCEHLDMLFISIIHKLLNNKKVKIIYEVADLHEVVYSNSKKVSSKLQRNLFKNIESILCKKIEKLIITSPYFWEDYYFEFVSKDKVLFIPNAPEKTVLKVQNKANTDKLTIGYVGAVRYPKQLKMLIDIAKKTNEIDVFIAGNGSAYNEIRNYCSNISNVKIYGSYDYEKDITKLYSKIDVVYSVYDTNNKNVKVALPNRLYESIVTTKPIIVSKGTKLAEFVKSKDVGFLVDAQEPDELEKLINNLLNNGNQMIDRCIANCLSIKNEYYIDHYNGKLSSIYKKLS